MSEEPKVGAADTLTIKRGDFVGVNPRNLHRSELKGRTGIVLSVSPEEIAVWLSAGYRDSDPGPGRYTFFPYDVHPEARDGEGIKRFIEHEVFMARSRRDRAKGEVLKVVDALVAAHAKVGKADAEIKLVQEVCPHDDECIGRRPAGSFTAEYFRCRICGREWSDD